MLDETGFSSAAQWYIEGFAKRSGIKVRMDFAPAVQRLRDTIEIALFRVLQESLTNVHRHSGTSEIDISFRRDAQVAILEVRDYGRGMPNGRSSQLGYPVKDPGVGLAGMRERLHELNGILQIEPANPGTSVMAIAPLFPELCQLAPATYVAGGPLPCFGINQASHSHAF